MSFTEDEIRHAVFSLGANKAPGLDDFNMRFYQHFWHILQRNFLDIFQAFYDCTIDPTRFNRSYIELVPKTVGARRIGEFRPISQINGIQKIISKVLANRLKEKICDLIDPSQSAFLCGRSILNCVTASQEIILVGTKQKLSIFFFSNWILLRPSTQLIGPSLSRFSKPGGLAADGADGYHPF